MIEPLTISKIAPEVFSSRPLSLITDATFSLYLLSTLFMVSSCESYPWESNYSEEGLESSSTNESQIVAFEDEFSKDKDEFESLRFEIDNVPLTLSVSSRESKPGRVPLSKSVSSVDVSIFSMATPVKAVEVSFSKFTFTMNS